MIFLDVWETMESCLSIKVRNRMLKLKWKKGNILRNLSVLAQRNDLQKWKDSVRYGQRWMDCRNCVLMFKENVW